jgi:hypothetical protein
MTVYELIQALTKYEPDDDVYMIDGEEETAVESVSKTVNGVIIKPWESYRRVARTILTQGKISCTSSTTN